MRTGEVYDGKVKNLQKAQFCKTCQRGAYWIGQTFVQTISILLLCFLAYVIAVGFSYQAIVSIALTWLLGALSLIWFNLIPAWISNHIHYKVWDEITYSFPNFNGCTVEVWERINNFNPHFIMGGNYLSMLGLKLIHVSKRGHRYHGCCCLQLWSHSKHSTDLTACCIIRYSQGLTAEDNIFKLVSDGDLLNPGFQSLSKHKVLWFLSLVVI